jgi:Phage tail assembly chaperone proteins, E, or 41 or 14
MATAEAKQEAPEAAPPEPAVKAVTRPKEIVIDLEMPVLAYGDEIKKLTFRRPTGGDIIAMGSGYPINIDWATGRVTPNGPVMAPMMSRLASVPQTTIDSLDANDWATCSHALMGFFTPGAQAMQF